MILTETSARKPSRLAFWIVLGLGAVLLPLAPGAAKPEGSETDHPAEPARRQVDQQRDLLLSHGVQSCATCHASQSVHTWDLQAKPQSWKEIHDEIIRLADEVSRLKAQSGIKEAAKSARAGAPVWGYEFKADKSLPAAAPDRSEEIEKLKDEIELLKLKVQLKGARRAGTQAKIREAQRRYDLMEETNRRTPGVINKDRMMEVWLTRTDLKAEAAVQDIEWQEATVLLKQAERRLARLQRPAEKSDNKGQTQQDKRLQELEQKVERLLKEIQKLRREKQGEKPRDPGRSSTMSLEDRLWQELGLRLRPVGSPPTLNNTNNPKFRGGMVVEAIRAASPAWDSGLKEGDTLVGLDKFEVICMKDFQYLITRPELAETRRIKFFCIRGGEIKNGTFELGKFGNNDHQEARGFIDHLWPNLGTTRLEDNIPKAQKAFQICKAVGDRSSLQKLAKGTERHADRLAKELAELRPDVIADDVIPAQKFKKVREQIVKLGWDINDYWKTHADDR